MKSMTAPRFFVTALGTGGPTPSIEFLVPEAREAAALFMHERLLDRYVTKRIARAFFDNGLPYHVCLDHALRPEMADAIGRDLLQTSFVPHHHAPYPLHVAPHATLPAESVLTRFITWLRSPLAAVYHTALAGIAHLPRSVTSAWVQVQIARMTTGESFPLHIDTEEEGITCVYQFTRGYGDDDGGQLYFSSSAKDSTPELVIPPVFGSLLLFRPKGAAHAVTLVKAPADKPRFTVTAFYLYGKHRSEEYEKAE